MALLATVLVGLIIVVVAIVVVLREVRKLGIEPTPPVFNIDEAFEWVVERVPYEVAATLTPDDVYRVLAFQTELFAARGASANGSAGRRAEGAVIGAAEIVEYVIERAAATGEEYLIEQVNPVIEVLLAYLEEIGAVGPAAGRAVPRSGTEAAESPEPES